MPRADTSPRSSVGRSIIVLAGFVAAAIAIGSFVISQAGTVHGPTQGQPVVVASAQPMDSIPCDPSEHVTYHEHAFIAIVNHGRPIPIGPVIGQSANCFYWIHTHDASGVIHIEAPHHIVPKLGVFFDLWAQPLSDSRAAGAVVKTGETMRVFVGGKRFTGNPRGILLHPHTVITIEVGPPWSPPKEYKFDGL